MPRHIVRMHFMTTLVVFLVVRFCSGIFCSSQNRKINSNGTACTELEHCVSSFNPQTGECLGPGNQCDPGWMGPGCQYVNLAFHPGMNSDPVFDGDMTTHRTIEDGRATIRFNGIFNINALRIRTIPSNGQQGTLSVRDNQNRILYNDSFPSSSPTVFFTNSSLTNGLHMEFSPSLDIAEIEVFGGKNVALWKSTHQSTTYSYDGISFTPDKAVDGNGNGDWDIHTCTHTQPSGDHPTWSVDLGNVYYIIAIKIKNRNDNQDRLNGFKIYGTPEKGDLLLIYNDSSQTHNRSEIFLDSSHMVDVPIKMISIKGSNTGEKILTLCEVYIYASIKRKNGSFCPEKCQKNSNCRTDNLVCRTCQDGWEGPYCYPIVCQQPISWNAPHISTSQKTYRYNETIRFLCSGGYYLSENQERKCTKNGPLEPPFPNCIAITCQQPISWNSPYISTNQKTYRYNETIRFLCSEGYYLSENQERKCTKNGPLEPPFPNCIAITCQQPVSWNTPNISTNQNTYKYNETIRFLCSEGFYLQGNQERKCTKNGLLEPPFPNCTAITCQQPVSWKSTNISTNRKTYRYNETIRFLCSEGFYLQGNQERKCTKSGPLEPPFPNCTAITCQPPVSSEAPHIMTDKETYNYNEIIQFSCSEGFFLQANQERNCTKNGPLKPPYPNCKVSEEDNSLSEAVVAGVSVGSLAAIAAVVVVVIIVLRKRRSKKPDSKYYKNDALSLDDIDHQYAEVNANRTKKNKGASKQEEASNEQKTTYYNMNSHDVDKAKQARQEVYYEFSPVCRPSETAIPVTEFKNYVEIKKGNQEFFAEQFKKFYTGLQFPATAAVAPGNKSKNKYKNIYPYDETRVLLKVEKGSSDSDFINASFIHGFGNVKSYIAAQGPLINTIDDFWWMVWNEKSDKIVMLTNLSEDDKVKCIKYWPDSDSMDTRNMKLELVVSESFADFTIRTFNLINGKESRTIRQFHFTAWPDKGVPAYASSLVHFHSKVIHTPGTLKGPMVVHCSAGIGRTGTFIALNYLVQQAKESGYVDVFECVETLRRQRLNMVQTLEQYKFLHNATLEALMCTSSDPSASKFPQIYEDLFKVDAETGKRNIDLNFENLNVALSTLPESAYSLAKNSTNRKKNRYSNILPVDFEMPEIRDEENNPIYINAVFLPAYKSKRSFIATQMPLKDTVVDFWRLLYEQQVSTIVMLNQLGSDKPKENIGKYWPKDLNAVFEFGPFRITKKGLTEGKDFTIVDLCCHKEGQNEDERKLRLFQCHFWPDSSTVPTSVLAFLKLINDVELHHDRNNSGPLVVHCMNGAEKSGLFCVMQVVLERMKIEQDVAIHHVIQQMRSIRPSIIPNVEQFKFCHDVVLEFLKQFDDYSNFQ
nr:receptor-type tyrosine-protein phosphatase mu isoform X5 [Crassostrea gigas]